MLDATEVAASFFPDGEREDDGMPRLHMALDECPHHGDRHGEPARIVGDPRSDPASPDIAYFDRGLGLKDRIQVSGNYDGLPIGARSVGREWHQHVADVIELGFQVQRFYFRGYELGSGAFLEGWSRCAGDLDLVVEDGLALRAQPATGGQQLFRISVPLFFSLHGAKLDRAL